MRRLTYILILLEVLLTSCNRPDEVDFLVLYTTQLYGNLLPWDFKNDTIEEVTAANFMTLVNEQRAIYGDRCIVLDVGNMHTRGLANFYWHYIDTLSEPLSFKAQRYIGYDAVAMGHSDMRLAEPFIAQHHNPAKYPPTICTNLFDRRTGETFFTPWVCLERQGIKVAIFSLVDEDADFWTPQLGHPDAECKEMIECMRTQILKLRHECKPDLVIGLVSSPRDPKELRLQEQIPGIDLVIGIDLAGSASRNYAGMVRMKLTRDEKTDSYSMKPFTVAVDLSQYEVDPDYTEFFADDIATIRARYKEEFGKLDDDIITSYGIYSSHDYYRDILHQAQLYYSGADISFANIANADKVIPAGSINISKIGDLFSHENVLVQFKATGQEIKNIIESFYAQQYNRMTSPQDPLLALRHDKKGHQMWNSKGQPYLNVPPARFTSCSGMYYTVDLRRTPGDRVFIHSLHNGKPYHPDSTYSVATNSYIASGFEHLPYLGWDKYEIRRRFIDFQMPNIVYVIYKYFHDCPGAYTPTKKNTCDFIPEDWWREAKSRELQNLNPTW